MPADYDETIRKLRDLRLGVMADAFTAQLAGGAADDAFAARFGQLVDEQWEARESSRFARRLKAANLKLDASIEGIDFTIPRGLHRFEILGLADLGFVAEKRNLIITGPTGVGKTYLACAFARRACERGYTAAYRRTPRLVSELAESRADGTYLDTIARLAKIDVLILDDWGLSPLDDGAASDVMDVIDDRTGVRSIIISSQLPVSRWHGEIADPSIADALLDRLVHRSERVEMTGHSMRRETQPEG